jgi:hypothetical protein
MTQLDAWRMIPGRGVATGIHAPIGNHTFRATGVGADRKDLCLRRGFGSNDVAMAPMGRLAPRHGEDERVILFVL